jgi:hypothetical protein
LTVVADKEHSVPNKITIVADGVPVQTLLLPAVKRGPEGTRRSIDVRFDPVTAKDVQIRFDGVDPKVTVPVPDAFPLLLPISIAEVGISALPTPAAPATVDTGCRTDLAAVNGQPFPIEIRGRTADARRGLDIVGCDPSLTLPAGSNTLTTSEGLATGWNVDRVVLSSDTAGKPTAITPAGAPIRDSGATVRTTSSTPDSYHLRVHTDGSPFWLVLGESHSDGWQATAAGKDLGSPTLVNGFANGWQVRPGHAGTIDIALRWTPQRLVWIGIGASVLAVLVCLALVFWRRRRVEALHGPALTETPKWTSPATFGVGTPRLADIAIAAAVAGVVAALFSRWTIGVLVAAAIFLAPRITRGRLLFAAGAPIALAAGALFDVPELGWVALGLLLADLVTDWWWHRR